MPKLLCAVCVFFTFNVSAQTASDFLARKLTRGDTEQKRDALTEIRNLQTAEASRLAVPALKDASAIVRATAATAVIFLPSDEAAANLLPLLQDKNFFVRREAAYALGKVGDAQAINPLIQIFQKDKISEVNNASIVALGEIGDASAIAELTNILQRKPQAKEEFMRRSAARSIGQIAQIIQTGKRLVMTPENFAPVESKLPAKPNYIKLNASFPAFDSAVGVLIQTLQNVREFADVKREAAFALGAIGDKAAINVLQTHLNSEDYYLSEICREALRKIAVYAEYAKIKETN